MKDIKDALYGFVIGDAMGVPIEFLSREELIKRPVTTMMEYGTHNMPAGVWSDDTSMTLATMDSIAEHKGISYEDIMEKFLLWYGKNEYTATDKVFDIGKTTYNALLKYAEAGLEPVKCGLSDIKDNGNGSLMRMLPIAFYAYNKKLKDNEIYNLVSNTSSLTHAHEISILGCYIYVKYIIFLLNGKDKFASLNMVKSLDFTRFSENTLKAYNRILEHNINKEKLENIKSTGYIVDTLETVFWVILNTDSFEQAIIGSINLGDDTDTNGAITGSIAGILYGFETIPTSWLSVLKNKELLNKIINKFNISLN